MTDREWAITWIESIKDKYIHGGDESYDDCRRRSIDMAIEALKQPEIVRCKNCKYGHWWSSEQVIVCDKLGKTFDANWFCADGVRKDERIYHQS